MVSPEKIYELFCKSPVISTDSRKIEPGCIFFAIRGDRFDGNLFAENAMLKGAAYTVVDDRNVIKNDHYLLVENVLASLQQLSLMHRKQFSIPVIGITGSNGKTTTKELISAVLSMKYTTLATSGNLNNHIGVPLTLLKIDGSIEIAVIEMGANHPGEIGFLCNLALPGYGIVTNVGKAHLEGLITLEGVIRTKTELYRYLQSTGGKIFININNGTLVEHTGTLEMITYGTGTNADVNGNLITSQPFINFTLNIGNNSVNVSSKLFGDYNLENLLAAACVGNYFGVPVEEIKSTLENYEPSNNRSQVTQSEKNLLILDAYNANPTSMQATLNNFSSSAYNNKVVILGDMLELGDASDEEHMAILRMLGDLNFQEVYLVGPVFTRINDKREWICFHDSDLASLWFGHHKITGKTILVKGSRGIKMEQIIKEL